MELELTIRGGICNTGGCNLLERCEDYIGYLPPYIAIIFIYSVSNDTHYEELRIFQMLIIK